MELHFLEDNIDRMLQKQENPAFSMMGYGPEKIQGELVIKMQNLKNDQMIRFGWLFTNKSESQTYDGLAIQTTFDAEHPEQMNFKALDVWSTRRVDVLSNGLRDLNMDETQNWSILAGENSVVCSADREDCEFRVRFSRDMDTGDRDDLKISASYLQEF